ncbi:glyceraldehyde 3-phosphate dehydrogenase [Paucimonas lemoignei]|uniref:Glyceraldehyde 3-phosphate dehydrogenase n=1 Tax=Paucimonas lemoignei TaxID=29443 RepID=A0A4R3I096_PAULE|nr:glyceraldehyde 3-phosphate dehydrogenase NAD-binding domain-containing protein [Paucimonas lemoignei]TCS37985.1 glyceraldehyde 3-phosphate dehydrogenase [Paucimonas lemoignei]
MISAGLNGLGRFGLHLLRRWLDKPESPVRIVAINDAYRSLDAAVTLLRTDAKVSFADCDVSAEGETMVIARRGQPAVRLAYTHGPAAQAGWRGQTEWWLECSGQHTAAHECREFLTGRTRRVIVSATCVDADQTLVYGYNHDSLDPAAQVISYGSCTVNAFVPLAHWLHRLHGVAEAEVGVIHNVPQHKLAAHPQPERRACTLQYMGPRLLPFLEPERFHVDYVLIPYTGVSLIDFRFRLASPAKEASLLDALEAACRAGELQGLYRLADEDSDPASWAMSPESAILLRPRIRLSGDRLFLPAYFDNENSATRYLDLLEYLALRGA